MKKDIKYVIAAAIALFLLLGGIGFAVKHTEAAVTFTVPTQPANTYKYFTFFSGTTTTATSTNTTDGGGYFIVAGAQQVTMYFSRAWDAAGNAGSTNFKVQVSPDGTNWYDYKTLYQNTASSTYGYTVASETISAATSTTVDFIDMTKGTFYAIRCIAVETTDGAHTCKAAAEF